MAACFRGNRTHRPAFVAANSIQVMRAAAGQVMTAIYQKNCRPMRRPRSNAFDVLILAGVLSFSPLVFINRVDAQALSYAPALPSAFPSDDAVAPAEPDPSELPERLRRTTVALNTNEAPGTIIIDTGNTLLYYVLGQGRAIRYGVGVGRDGFTWSGVETITNKAEWPDWHPPARMIARQPYLPRFMAGGPGNPLGARAMYLGASEYRIHGTNDPTTIGKFVSSGCIRLTNEDVIDLFSRVSLGTRVVVLPKNGVHLVSRPVAGGELAAAASPPGAVVTTPASGRQALNLPTSPLY
jgi:lipoprotein-anchoring transpeptidase ErfK/SrfK